MALKSIRSIFSPPPFHMVGDGFRVHNFIPSYRDLSMEAMNPLIMMDYASAHNFLPTDKPRGVDVHPHRGFETVTIAYKGSVAHHDSAGNAGVIQEGDVQWMTAGSGVLHKEYHEKEFAQRGGEFQMVQLWINLPAAVKMSAPTYQEIKSSAMQTIQVGHSNSVIHLIAGCYGAYTGPAKTFTPIHMMNCTIDAGDSVDFNFPSTNHTIVLVVEGNIHIQGYDIQTDHLACFQQDGEEFTISSALRAKMLVLSAAPLHEPIAAHGPFVMNTPSEIIQAFEDVRHGKFGKLQ